MTFPICHRPKNELLSAKNIFNKCVHLKTTFAPFAFFCPDGLRLLLMKTCGLRLNNTDFITTTITPACKTAAGFSIMHTPKQGIHNEYTKKIKKEKSKENYEKYTKEVLKIRGKIYQRTKKEQKKQPQRLALCLNR